MIRYYALFCEVTKQHGQGHSVFVGETIFLMDETAIEMPGDHQSMI